MAWVEWLLTQMSMFSMSPASITIPTPTTRRPTPCGSPASPSPPLSAAAPTPTPAPAPALLKEAIACWEMRSSAPSFASSASRPAAQAQDTLP